MKKSILRRAQDRSLRRAQDRSLRQAQGKLLRLRSKYKIPKEMKWLFWSYDINSLDLEKDKDYIIPQVLNYGTWKDVQWLFKVYPEKEIVKAIKNPGRGLWFEKVLNFWLKMLDIRLKKNIYQKALINLQKF